MEKSVLKRPVRSMVTLSGLVDEMKVEIRQPQEVKYLFTTRTCPNCKMAREYLKGEKYLVIDAEENMELARRYGVMQAPTLVVVEGNDSRKYVNASNIKKYADQRRAVPV